MKQVFLILMLAGFMASCIDDESTGADRPISTLSFVTELEEEYVSSKNDEFVLPAPEVKQENQVKELSYEWQVNYEVVSTKAELHYICEECGTFDCRLKISNEDGAIFKEFKLNVPFPYEDGLLVLSSYDNRTMLSFKNLTPEEPFELDVFELNNHGLQMLGTTPKDICFFGNSYGDSYVYVATENPTCIARLEYNTMIALSAVDYPADGVERLYCFEESGQVYTVGDGRFFRFTSNPDYFYSGVSSTISAMYPDLYVTGEVIQAPDQYGDPYWSIVYDEHSGSFLNVSDGSWSEEGSPGEVCADLKGMTFVAMQPGRAHAEMLAIVKDADGKFIVHRENVVSKKAISSVNVPTDAGMSEDGVFLTSKKADNLLYSNGNQIYIYYYSSDGNFESTPYFIVGEPGDMIKDMVFDANEEKLYVAVDAVDGDYKGAVYCYDYASRQLLWKERGVAGEIVRMIYKNK